MNKHRWYLIVVVGLSLLLAISFPACRKPTQSEFVIYEYTRRVQELDMMEEVNIASNYGDLTITLVVSKIPLSFAASEEVVGHDPKQ